MTHDSAGRILDVGRRTRTIPVAIARALEARDQGCRFPGCTNRIVDAHHVRHWADGGPTCLDNLLLLCRRHHRAVHEEGYRVARTADGGFAFTNPQGRLIPAVPAMPVCVGTSESGEAAREPSPAPSGSANQSPHAGADSPYEPLDLDWTMLMIRTPPQP